MWFNTPRDVSKMPPELFDLVEDDEDDVVHVAPSKVARRGGDFPGEEEWEITHIPLDDDTEPDDDPGVAEEIEMEDLEPAKDGGGREVQEAFANTDSATSVAQGGSSGRGKDKRPAKLAPVVLHNTFALICVTMICSFAGGVDASPAFDFVAT